MQQALDALDAHLVKRDLGLIQLFDPPFDKSHQNPGYIKGYVPGVRENGGQYTHAAVWAVMAFAAASDNARAWELFRPINPVRHGNSEAAIATYKIEPYVVAADVYTNPQHAGRGGWTWYTGSAGWMYRLITESLLGVHLEVGRLRIELLSPADWNAFDLHYRYRETFHHIHVRRVGTGNLVARVVVDGVHQPDKRVPLLDDRREHHAEVEIGMPGVVKLSVAGRSQRPISAVAYDQIINQFHGRRWYVATDKPAAGWGELSLRTTPADRSTSAPSFSAVSRSRTATSFCSYRQNHARRTTASLPTKRSTRRSQSFRLKVPTGRSPKSTCGRSTDNSRRSTGRQ